MSNFTKSTSYYDYLFVELADPRTSNWLFMKDPRYVLIILVVYLYFVNVLGPNLMKYRKPWRLTKILIVYNVFQVIISNYLFIQGINKAWRHYNWTCEPCDYSNNPDSVALAGLVHTYFLVKVVELLDTVFFVLRKKKEQITFLHLYHHSMMLLIGWILTKYIPGGHTTFEGLINSFVHIIMYGYYLLAALGPQYQKYLWWKKYLTTLQLVQFLVAFLHSSQLIFIDCGYPKWPLIITLPNAALFYYMFNEFYTKNYGNNKTKEMLAQENKAKLNDDNNNVIEMKTK